MIELAIQVFAITVEVIFPAPRTFSKDLIDNDALTDSTTGFAVPPEQLRLRQADVLFGYDLDRPTFWRQWTFLRRRAKSELWREERQR
ncbi:MAG: hypothetical protein JO232_22845 [Verrucomicrobia bacterium]|nr:hypothetical protein [Verrucomicrobiota bacterium]